jgi:hypothetical protein
MLHPELSARMAREQYNDNLSRAARNRLVAAAGRSRLTLSRRAARPLGRVLLRLSVRLLRYGLIEIPATTRAHRASARSVELN